MGEAVALITGASSGIGAELAREFAAHGHRVALTARREGALTALATELAAAGARPPIVVPCDLSRPDGGEIIAAALAAEGVEVAYLVNNAGYGLLGRARDLERGAQLGIVDLNIRALTDLTLRFADAIVRHRGGILNVGSIAGFLPGPGMAVYYASKAYVVSLSEALHYEFGRDGVRVTALCPGPVPSGFQARAGFAPGFDSTLLRVSARAAARAGYRGLMANKRVVLPGFGVRLIPFLLRFAPRGLVLSAAGRLQARR
jgi:short-subunit dehydrogenase